MNIAQAALYSPHFANVHAGAAKKNQFGGQSVEGWKQHTVA